MPGEDHPEDPPAPRPLTSAPARTVRAVNRKETTVPQDRLDDQDEVALAAARNDDAITFKVKPHPAIRELGRPPIIGASIKVKGKIRTRFDHQAGERFTISIADADGTIVGTGVGEFEYPAFVPIRSDGSVVGTERVHTAEID